jgi:hypothetical protein
MKTIVNPRKRTSRARAESIIRPHSDCAIISLEKRKRPNPIRQIRTFCVGKGFSSNRNFRLTVASQRQKAVESENGGDSLRREVVNHSVHSSPGTFDHAVRDVLGGDRRIFRHVPGCANGSRLKCPNAEPQCEKYRK